MYKTVNFLFVLFLSVFLFTSCEKEPILEVSQSSLTFIDQGGTQSISFSTNKDWTASVSGGTGWCTITPASGNSDIKTISVTTVANTTYDDRTATITINAEELSKVITITQPKNRAIILTKDSYEVGTAGGNISVELNSNIEYDVTIPTENQTWITNTTTKGLTTSTLTFAIASNETYDSRKGKIIIKDKTTTFADTVHITQAQLDIAILSQKKHIIPNSGSDIDIKYQTNINLKLEIPENAKSWIFQIQTKGLRDEIFQIEIDANNYPEKRSAYIYLYDNVKNIIIDSVKIEQLEQADEIYWVKKMGRLFNSLTKVQIDTIKTMIIKGEINQDDFTKVLNIKRRFLDLSAVKCNRDEIPNDAFKNNNYLEKIKLPNSIKDIGSYAFFNCSALTGNLIIPDSVKTIRMYAFSNCTSLAGNLIIPEGVVIIDDGAFKGCKGFSGDLVIPNTVTYIGDYTFNELDGITGHLKLSDNLTNIGSNAFLSSRLTGTLIIPNKVKSIGEKAFYRGYGFTGTLEIPSSVEIIHEYAFTECTGLTKLILNEGIKTIESGAFAHCWTMSGKLTFPNSLTSINTYAFYGCKSFSELELGNSLVEIGNSSFYGCYSLANHLEFPNTIKNIGYRAFRYCTKIPSISLPSSLETIDREAFGNCYNLTSLTIPSSVKQIGDQAFTDCNIVNLILEEGIEVISWNVFQNCKKIIGEVLIPKSIKTIKGDAFNNCENISAFKVQWENPITYYSRMFDINTTIKVPIESINKYLQAGGWKNHPIVGY